MRKNGNYKDWLQRKESGKHREYMQKVKTEVLTHYGRGRLVCVRCGFNDMRALSLDHIDGTGWAEKYNGHALYMSLRGKGYPDGYQTFCMNCQFIKREENKEYKFDA